MKISKISAPIVVGMFSPNTALPPHSLLCCKPSASHGPCAEGRRRGRGEEKGWASAADRCNRRKCGVSFADGCLYSQLGFQVRQSKCLRFRFNASMQDVNFRKCIVLLVHGCLVQGPLDARFLRQSSSPLTNLPSFCPIARAYRPHSVGRTMQCTPLGNTSMLMV